MCRLLISAFSIFILLSSCSNQQELQINEADIVDVCDSIKQSFDLRDFDSMLLHFSEEVLINVDIPTPQGVKNIELNKESYRLLLEEIVKMADSYSYEISDMDVTINEDGTSAIVTSTLSETLIMSGQTINSTTYEKTTFELIEKKPMVTSFSAKLSKY